MNSALFDGELARLRLSSARVTFVCVEGEFVYSVDGSVQEFDDCFVKVLTTNKGIIVVRKDLIAKLKEAR